MAIVFFDDYTAFAGNWENHTPDVAPASFAYEADEPSQAHESILGIGGISDGDPRATLGNAIAEPIPTETDGQVGFTIRLQLNVTLVESESNRFASIDMNCDAAFLSHLFMRWTPSDDEGAAIQVTWLDPTEAIFGEIDIGLGFGDRPPEEAPFPVVITITVTPTQISVRAESTLDDVTNFEDADFTWITGLHRMFFESSTGFVTAVVFESLRVNAGPEDPEPPGEDDRRGFALDMKPNGFGLIELGHHALAVHADPLTDQLYLVLDMVDEPAEAYLPLPSTAPEPADPFVRIYEFDSPNSGDDLAVYQYRGKLNRLANPATFCYCQVKADDFNNVLLNLYGDNVLIFTQVLTDKEPFTLPMLDQYETFEIELIGTSRIESVRTAETIEELMQEG